MSLTNLNAAASFASLNEDKARILFRGKVRVFFALLLGTTQETTYRSVGYLAEMQIRAETVVRRDARFREQARAVDVEVRLSILQSSDKERATLALSNKVCKCLVRFEIDETNETLIEREEIEFRDVFILPSDELSVDNNSLISFRFVERMSWRKYVEKFAYGDRPNLILTAPADNTLSSAVSVTFSWLAVATYDQYLLEVATDVNFQNLAHSSLAITLSREVALERGVRYWWRVTATNDIDTPILSNPRTLIVALQVPSFVEPTPDAAAQVINFTGATLRVQRGSNRAAAARFRRRRLVDDQITVIERPYILDVDNNHYATLNEVYFNAQVSDANNEINISSFQYEVQDFNDVTASNFTPIREFGVTEIQPTIDFPSNSSVSRASLIKGNPPIVLDGDLDRVPDVPYRLINEISAGAAGVVTDVSPIETNSKSVQIELRATFGAMVGNNELTFRSKARYFDVSGKAATRQIYITVSDPAPLVEVASDLVWGGSFSQYYTANITATDQRCGTIINRGSLGGNFIQATSTQQFNVRTAQLGGRRLFRNGDTTFANQQHSLAISPSTVPEGVFTAIFLARHQRVSQFVNRFALIDFNSGNRLSHELSAFNITGAIISRTVRTFIDSQVGSSLNTQPFSSAIPATQADVNTTANLNSNDNTYVAIAVVSMQSAISSMWFGGNNYWQNNQRFGAYQLWRGDFLATAEARNFALQKAKHIGDFFGLNTGGWSL